LVIDVGKSLPVCFKIREQPISLRKGMILQFGNSNFLEVVEIDPPAPFSLEIGKKKKKQTL